MHDATVVSGSLDISQPVEIAPRVWWVGEYLPDDPFQCHVYLVENGTDSVIIDPGSRVTWPAVRGKIEKVLPLSSVRYFVCQHQDPDIAASLPLIDEEVTRDDAVVVTHWRAHALLKHYGLKMPFWMIDEHEWRLPLDDERSLEFIFTPYAHFPGAFVTFERRSGVVFSSDLFGGFTDGFSLYAKDEDYFDALRPFHEHYMPSSEILAYAVGQIERLPVQMIAPQHGSIIPRHLIRPICQRLKTLDCGLYLFARGDTDIRRLSELNAILRDVTQTMVSYREFKDFARNLTEIIRRALAIRYVEFHARTEDADTTLLLSPHNGFRGGLMRPPRAVRDALALDPTRWDAIRELSFGRARIDDGTTGQSSDCLVVPLFTPDQPAPQAVALFHLDRAVELSTQARQVLERICLPLQVAVEREALYRLLDLERRQSFDRSVHDALTGLYNRFYMSDVVGRMTALHDRQYEATLGLVRFDIDHFKAVNEAYGRAAGDEVLRRVGIEMQRGVRTSDLAARLGSEEFALFTVGDDLDGLVAVAQRVRENIGRMDFGDLLRGHSLTASFGLAMRAPGESLGDLLLRGERALLAAKGEGRDRIAIADPPRRPDKGEGLDEQG